MGEPLAPLNKVEVIQAADGSWRGILSDLGADPAHLDGKHHPCPFCGGKDRFRFDDKDGTGSYFCSQCGPGDGLAFAAKLLNLDIVRDFSIVLARVAELVGSVRNIQPTKPNKPRTDYFKKLFDESKPLAGTMAETYLIKRGLSGPFSDCFRFHPGIKTKDNLTGKSQTLPALLSVATNNHGDTTAVQAVFLNLDGSGLKAGIEPVKRSYGKVGGSSVKVATGTGPNVRVEGPEKGVALSMAYPEMTIETTLGVAGFSNKPMDGITEIILAADLDEPGSPAEVQTMKAKKSLEKLGFTVRVTKPQTAKDWDDLLRAGGIEAVKAEYLNGFLSDEEPPVFDYSDSNDYPPESEAGEESVADDLKIAEVKAYNEERNKFPFIVKDRYEKGTRNGTYYLPYTKNAMEIPPPIWFCSPLHITARARDFNQANHSLVLEFEDQDNHKQLFVMPSDMLAGDGLECRRKLLSLGLKISEKREQREYLTQYLNNAKPEKAARSVSKTGWHNGVYVLPDSQTIGESEERILLQTMDESKGFGESGSLEDWQREVAAPCAGNSRLVFSVSTAFAAPLLHVVGEESGGFHYAGPSSGGKTTALKVAVSVSGPPDRLARWRATSNGLEAIAEAFNDSLLCLDELAQVDPKEAGEIAYMLANGDGKARMTRGGAAKAKSSWRLLFLSAGELGLAAHMLTAGKRAKAGQETRMADIPADAGAGLGLFENLHGHKGGAEFARAITKATKLFYGTACKDFLSKIVGDLDDIAGAVDSFRTDFLNENVPTGADGQVHRVAGRFALVAAAGELATAVGVTGWEPGESIQAAQKCFSAWVESRGGTGAQEVETALSQVRKFFELHGESRFSKKGGEDHKDTINRAGFRQEVAGNTEFWVLPEVFKAELCQGLDMGFVIKLLVEKGWIVPDKTTRKAISTHWLPGMQSKKCYHVRALFLDGVES